MNPDQLERSFAELPEVLVMVNSQSLVHTHQYPEETVQPLIDAAAEALRRHNHQCVRNFSLLGSPADCEKLAKAFTDILRLPFVAIRGLLVEEVNDLFVTIAEVCEETVVKGFSLEVVLAEPPPELSHLAWRYFSLPSLVCFVDELEDLPRPVLRRLLKATNRSRPYLETEYWTVECGHVCWMLASRNRGLLERVGLEVVKVG